MILIKTSKNEYRKLEHDSLQIEDTIGFGPFGENGPLKTTGNITFGVHFDDYKFLQEIKHELDIEMRINNTVYLCTSVFSASSANYKTPGDCEYIAVFTFNIKATKTHEEATPNTFQSYTKLQINYMDEVEKKGFYTLVKDYYEIPHYQKSNIEPTAFLYLKETTHSQEIIVRITTARVEQSKDKLEDLLCNIITLKCPENKTNFAQAIKDTISKLTLVNA